LSRQQASDGPPTGVPGPRRTATADAGPPPGPPRYALWLAIGLQAVISTGDGLVLIALASLVYHQGSHAWAVAAVFLAVTIPITSPRRSGNHSPLVDNRGEYSTEKPSPP